MAKQTVNNGRNTIGAHPGGRPTKYTSDIVDRLEGYIRNCQNKLPSKAGFAKIIGVHVNTMDYWGRKHPEFLWALKRLHAIQEDKLINKGLAGRYNPTICKLLLINNHGYGKRRDAVNDNKPTFQNHAEQIFSMVK